MSHVFIRVVMIGGFLGCVIGWFGPTHAAEGNAVKGKANYDKLCVACHGAQGKGDGPTGPALKPPAADFTSAASKKKSPAELRRIIEEGKPGTAMIPWKGQLSDGDITDLMAYLATLRK